MKDTRFRPISSENVDSFFSLLLFSGIALVISLPPADQVKDIGALAFLSGEPVYFYVFMFFLGVLGLSLGAMSAARHDVGYRMCVHILAQIGLAVALTVPYLAFARGIYPERLASFAFILIYSIIVSFLVAVVARMIEERSGGKSPLGFLAKYALFMVYYFAPLIAVPWLSPIGFVTSLFWGASVGTYLLGYATPLLLLACVLVFYRRSLRSN